jgi:hypothetical protein
MADESPKAQILGGQAACVTNALRTTRSTHRSAWALWECDASAHRFSDFRSDPPANHTNYAKGRSQSARESEKSWRQFAARRAVALREGG